MAITVKELEALTPANDGDRLRLGDSMLGVVRASKDGGISVNVTWRYRFGGRVREIPLGTWASKSGPSLKSLRDERERLAALVRSGQDPIEVRRAEKLALQRQAIETQVEHQVRLEELAREERDRERKLTVSQLFARWRETDLQPRVLADGKRVGRKDGGRYVLEQFERHVFHKIGDTPLDDLRKADLLALLDVPKASGKMRTANVLLADLKQMLDFATERELIPANPLALVKKSKVGGPSVERERKLSGSELQELVLALRQSRLSPRSSTAIWLVLASAVRVGELMGAVWADCLPTSARARSKRIDELRTVAERHNCKFGVVNLTERTWYLPDTKNQRDHTIHLSEFAVGKFTELLALREVLKDSPDGELSPWVFPATDNHNPVCIKSFGKQLADRQRGPNAPLKNRSVATDSLWLSGGRWTAHDLRRTAASLMSDLGFSGDVIDECLNHKIASKARRIYIRNRREADQRRAFDALGMWLHDLCAKSAGYNVVPLRTA